MKPINLVWKNSGQRIKKKDGRHGRRGRDGKCFYMFACHVCINANPGKCNHSQEAVEENRSGTRDAGPLRCSSVVHSVNASSSPPREREREGKRARQCALLPRPQHAGRSPEDTGRDGSVPRRSPQCSAPFVRQEH